MTRIEKWLAIRLSQVIAFIVGVCLMDSIVMGLEPEPPEPKGKLAKFFYIPEVARVPLMIGVAVILTPWTVAQAIRAKIPRNGEL